VATGTSISILQLIEQLKQEEEISGVPLLEDLYSEVTEEK